MVSCMSRKPHLKRKGYFQFNMHRSLGICRDDAGETESFTCCDSELFLNYFCTHGNDLHPPTAAHEIC